MKQLQWLAGFLPSLFSHQYPTHLASIISVPTEEDSWKAEEPTKAAALSHPALGALDLDGAIIAGCCKVKLSLPKPWWMHPLESTLTGWQNSGLGKSLCLKHPLTPLMTSLDRTCNNTEATCKANFFSTHNSNGEVSISCFQFQESKGRGSLEYPEDW